jgi:hypothetical protein
MGRSLVTPSGPNRVLARGWITNFDRDALRLVTVCLSRIRAGLVDLETKEWLESRNGNAPENEPTFFWFPLGPDI